MTAQPTEDPTDPLVILQDLPEREREEFLLQYHRAVDAALTRRLPAPAAPSPRVSLTVIAAGQAGYYEELAAARAGTVMTVPVTDAIPDWAAVTLPARQIGHSIGSAVCPASSGRLRPSALSCGSRFFRLLRPAHSRRAVRQGCRREGRSSADPGDEAGARSNALKSQFHGVTGRPQAFRASPPGRAPV